MKYIITFNIGTKYSLAYTICLWHAVRERVSVPYRFICYTDKPAAMPNYIETREVPHGYHNGWWSKLMLFDDPDIPDDAEVTYMDMDVLLGPCFEKLLHLGDRDFLATNDFAHLGKDHKFNGSLMTWRYGKFREVTREFLRDGPGHVANFASDQNFLENLFSVKGWPYEYFDSERVVSWKWRFVPDRERVPDDWQLVAFHGVPSPIDALKNRQCDPVLREQWRPVWGLKNYRGVHSGARAELLLTGPSLARWHQDRSMVSLGVNSMLFEEGWELDYYLIQDVGREDNPRSYIGGNGAHATFVPGVAKWYGTFGFKGKDAAQELAGMVETLPVDLVQRDGFMFDLNKPAFQVQPPFALRNSVAFTALQMLVYMGFREIFVAGADITGGRIGESETQGHLDPIKDLLLEAWDEAREFCQRNGVRLVMVNPVGLKGRGFIEHVSEGGSPIRISQGGTSAPAVSPGEGMRFHLLGPPYAASSEKYALCAYTQKVLKWARMMAHYGYEVHHYGHPAHDLPDYVQHHTVIEDDDWQRCGVFDRLDWRDVFFDKNNKEVQKVYNERAREELKKYVRAKDFILHFWAGNQPAASTLKDVQIVEAGIGYTGIFATFKIFESCSIRNFCHGQLEGRKKRNIDIWVMDTVIPNYFDPKDFDFNSRGGDYLLYLGRIVSRKGLDIVVHLARDTGKNVVVAGQGKLENAVTKGLAIPKNVECVGYADIEKRRELLAGAEALLAPTRYNEPFGGVAVEAMLSGTPVICSDHGAFPETVDQGLGGLRCANYAAFLRAAREGAAGLDRHTVRSRAERYLLEAVAPLYHDYLSWLHALALDKRRRWWTPAESLAREP